MLTILGTSRNGGFCDNLTRRDFLTIGGTLLGGGLTLPSILAAEARSGTRNPHKAVINVFLPGGPPHLDMWDLKPEAPAEYRGEFHPVATKVPGIQICELFPKMASMMDRFTIIRSIVGSAGDHDSYQCMTGHRRSNPWPALGAWVSRVQGPVNNSVPAHLSLMYPTGEPRWGYPGDGGFLGKGHDPFRLVGGKTQNMKPDNLVLKDLTLERLQDRAALLGSLDSLQRRMGQRDAMDGMDAYRQQAFGILTSSKLTEALDLSKEPAHVLERYGVDDPAFERDGAPRMVRNFCLARRLIEAGARVVTMNFTRWDWHGSDGKNFVQARKDFPLLDRAVTALVTDLHERGLEKDVSVVVWGEFGRTPKINAQASRDHWPQVSCALLFGGGMRTGQVIGATDRRAERAIERPVTFPEVFATLYSKIGMDPHELHRVDTLGRPVHPIDPSVQPIHEVL